MKTQVKADIMLVLVTLAWGVSYLLIDISLTDLGPFTLNAYRFLIAFFAAVALVFPKLRGVSRETLKYSFLIAVSLVFVYFGATYGVLYTSLSNAGFLCALTVIFTPILGFIFFGKRPQRKLVFVVILALTGIALLTLNEQLRPAPGDLFCIICSVAYAFDLLITERAVGRPAVNAFQLGVFQLGFTGLFMLILSLLLETPAVPRSPGTWASVLFLAIFCTGVAFIVQSVAQQYTDASHVGVIFTLEPVFAGIVAFVFAGEVLLPQAYLGAVLLMFSLFIMEIDFSKFRKNRFEEQ